MKNDIPLLSMSLGETGRRQTFGKANITMAGPSAEESWETRSNLGTSEGRVEVHRRGGQKPTSAR